MKISFEEQNGVLRIFLSGELDHHCAKNLMESIDALIDEYLPVCCVIDLKKLSFTDSSGVAVILRVNKKMLSMNGGAQLENVSGQPLRVFEAAGLHRLLQIYSKENEGAAYDNK